jgi:hypothetical protein
LESGVLKDEWERNQGQRSAAVQDSRPEILVGPRRNLDDHQTVRKFWQFRQEDVLETAEVRRRQTVLVQSFVGGRREKLRGKPWVPERRGKGDVLEVYTEIHPARVGERLSEFSLVPSEAGSNPGVSGERAWTVQIPQGLKDWEQQDQEDA